MPDIVPEWLVKTYAPDGQEQYVFDNFVSLEVSMKRNEVGSFALTFYDEPEDERIRSNKYWKLDSQIHFIRWLPNYFDDSGKRVVPQDILFYGLLRQRVRSVDQNGNRLVTYSGFSNEHLLSRRAIAALEGTIRAEKAGAADWVMCEYANENCGPAAAGMIPGPGTEPMLLRGFYADYSDGGSGVQADGIMPGFSVSFPQFPGEGTYWQGVKSFDDNLLEVLKEIAAYSRVDFQVTSPGNAEFLLSTSFDYGFGANRTANGVDTSTGRNEAGYRPIVFDLEQDNVEMISSNLDRSGEATRVFVLGRGDRSTQSVLPWEDVVAAAESPWNIIEVSRSSSENDYIYQLQNTGNEILQDHRYQHVLTLSPRQTETTLFQKHYFLGDRVTGRLNDESEDFRIKGVDIRWQAHTESIVLELEAPIRTIAGSIPPQRF